MDCFIHRILTFKEAFPFAEIKISDMNGNDMTRVYEYSWSTDGVCWTGWVSYDQYCLIAKNIESDFYLRIHLTGSIGDVRVGGELTKCYNICIEPTPLLQDVCDNPNMFNPYTGLDCALLLQQQLVDTVICMFGIPIYYFKCDPDQSTADFTFKEFTMHNVVSVKQMKLMVEDGQMPSSNPKLTELAFEWEADWATELSKTQFAKAFGDKAIPKQRDFIYIPMMKRMWMVNSAYDEKNEGLLWHSTTWKLALTQYEDESNVLTEGFDDIIDAFVGKTYEETFGEIERKEQERLSAYDQVEAPKFAATNLYNIFMEDGTRKAYTKNDAEIADKILCNRNNVVARNLYKFKNSNGCVQYQKGLCGETGTISFIIETPGCLTGELQRTIATFGPFEFEVAYTDETFMVGIDDLYGEISPFSSYLVVYQWDRNNYTRELKVYKHDHRTDFPIYLLKPEHYWFDFENPVISVVKEYNEDYIIEDEQLCQIHAWPLNITNIKYYNKYLGAEAYKELSKYTTTHENCIINDLARPINSGRGYIVQ